MCHKHTSAITGILSLFFKTNPKLDGGYCAKNNLIFFPFPFLKTEFSEAPMFKNKSHEVGQATGVISVLPPHVLWGLTRGFEHKSKAVTASEQYPCQGTPSQAWEVFVIAPFYR